MSPGAPPSSRWGSTALFPARLPRCQGRKQVPLPPRRPPHSLFPVPFFKNRYHAILAEGQWHLPVALTGISRVTGDAEHLPKCSLVVRFLGRNVGRKPVPRGWGSVLQAAGSSAPREHCGRI